MYRPNQAVQNNNTERKRGQARTPLGLVRILAVCMALSFCPCCCFAVSGDNCVYDIIFGMDWTVRIAYESITACDEEMARQDEAEEERLRELGYPEGYDPDDPVGMGEVDPYDVMTPDVDEIMKQEAMDAWNDYNQPDEPQIYDRVIKP